MAYSRSIRSLIRILFLCVLVNSAHANTPPSKPGNLVAVDASSSSVILQWDASTDDKRVRHYRVFMDQKQVDTTMSLSYAIEGLEPLTTYHFDVDASDGKAYSFIASVSVTTPEAESTELAGEISAAAVKCRGKNKSLPECQPPSEEEPPTEDPTLDCRGKNKKLPACREPVEEEPPTEEPPTEEPPTEEPPLTTGPPTGWSIVFEDNFDGYGDLDTTSTGKLWRFETMQDGLHRAGNSGMDEFGNTNVPDWQSPLGKRWSGWYNSYNQDNAYRSAGNLVMQGLVSGEIDPTRPDDYIDNGVLTQYGSSKLYTSWIDTWSRKYDNALGRHITDPESPARFFKYGYFESRVNFSEMKTPGFRLSMWLMPASTDAEGQYLVESLAYDSDGDNGVEIDIFEYEWISTEYENRLQLSVHGGAAGSSSTNYDTAIADIAIHDGWHTVGLLWEADKLVWSIDGKIVKTVTDTSIIPDVYSYMIVSREMNSGVKTEGIDFIEAGDALEVLPYRPRDPGLYAQNIWEFKDRIATDRALVDYIKVWQP